MGGWMDYARVRKRNGLEWRPEPGSDNPYPSSSPYELGKVSRTLLTGDLNRMERDYLDPVYPSGSAPREAGTDPAAVCAAAVGVPVEMVRAVLAHVFAPEVHLLPGSPPAPG